MGNQTLWPMTNALVLARWWQAVQYTPTTTEAAAFAQYCAAELVLDPADTVSCLQLYNISIASQDAILATRYCTASDSSPDWQSPLGQDDGACGTVSCMPTNNWLRDDRLDGLNNLGRQNAIYGNPGAIWWLWHHNKTSEAIAEKAQAVSMWEQITVVAGAVAGGTATFRNELTTTATYGHLLSKIIYSGWQAMTLGFSGEQTGTFDQVALCNAIKAYDLAWVEYNSTLRSLATAATPFHDYYEGGHNEENSAPGIGASIDQLRIKAAPC